MSNHSVHFTEIRNKIIEEIQKAEKEILIAVAWFTDEKIIDVLNNVSKKGVYISIIIYDDKINSKDLFRTLYYNKAEIWVSKKMMHNKFCVIDDYTVINGSYNWTYNASTNSENIQISKGDYNLSQSFGEQFYSIRENCKKIDSHFNNVVDEIEDQLVAFQMYYCREIENQFKAPYFYKIENFKKSLTNKNFKIDNGIVIIKNSDLEYDFFKLLYFIRKDYPLKEVSKISSLNFNLPIIYEDVENISFDENNYHKVDQRNYVLVKKKNTVRMLQGLNKTLLYELDLIDGNGDVLTSVDHCEKMPCGYYVKEFNCFKIYDNNLNEVNIIGKGIDFIDNIGYVNYIVKDNQEKYGLWDFDGNNIIENKFDYYERECLKSYKSSIIKSLTEFIVEKQIVSLKVYLDNYFTINDNYFFELIDKIKLEGIIDDKNNFLVKDNFSLKNLIEKKDSQIIFREFPCVVYSQNFYTKDFGVEKHFINRDKHQEVFKEFVYSTSSREIKFTKIKNIKDNNQKYYFYSDNDYKYSDLYKEVSKINIILESDFNKLIELVDSNRYTGKRLLEKIKLDIKFYEKKYYAYQERKREEKMLKENKRCYIATLAYQDINHPKVELLRVYRDTILIKYYIGRVFIKYYYKYSPYLVNKLKNKPIINSMIRKNLDLIIKLITLSKKIANTYYKC